MLVRHARLLAPPAHPQLGTPAIGQVLPFAKGSLPASHRQGFGRGRSGRFCSRITGLVANASTPALVLPIWGLWPTSGSGMITRMQDQDRGRHTITGEGVGRPVLKPEEPERGYGGFVLFVLFIAFLALLNAGSGPSLPPAPTPPAARVAVFTGLGSAGDSKAGTITPEVKALQVKLEGGSYELSYSTAQSVDAAIADLATARKIFFANFATGELRGELQDADTILMVGRVFVHINEIGSRDILRSAITLYGKNTSAYFKYAQSPRGPPPDSSAPSFSKRIVVLGEIIEMDFGRVKDRSIHEARVLDLEPSPAERNRYEAAKIQHTLDVARIERVTQKSKASKRSHHPH